MATIEKIEKTSPSAFQQQVERAKNSFEQQLIPLGLSKEQIEKQSITELENSLERVNDAIMNPASFGTMTINSGISIITISNEARYEIGILPILLERKKLIVERLGILRGEAKLEGLEKLLDDPSSTQKRADVEEQIASIRAQMKAMLESAQEVDAEQARIKLQEEIERDERRQKMEIELQEAQSKLSSERSESRVKFIQGLLNKETIATFVGAILLITLAIVLSIAMFSDTESSEILNNSFLIILGFFFGQNANQSSSKQGQETDGNSKSSDKTGDIG